MNGRVDLSGIDRSACGARRRAPVRPRLLLALFTTVFCSFAWAAPPSDSTPPVVQNDLLGDQMLVRELMRLDAEQAAQRLRKGVSPSSPGIVPVPAGPARGVASQQRPSLQAIYGVGQRLLAEVTWQGQSYVYLKGQALPPGRKADASTLRLKSISARCVALQGPDRLFELCLGASGQEG